MLEEGVMNAADRIKSTEWSNLPGMLQAFSEGVEYQTNPQLNWRRLLRMFTATSNKTRIKNTFKKTFKTLWDHTWD